MSLLLLRLSMVPCPVKRYWPILAILAAMENILKGHYCKDHTVQHVNKEVHL